MLQKEFKSANFYGKVRFPHLKFIIYAEIPKTLLNLKQFNLIVKMIVTHNKQHQKK